MINLLSEGIVVVVRKYQIRAKRLEIVISVALSLAEFFCAGSHRKRVDMFDAGPWIHGFRGKCFSWSHDNVINLRSPFIGRVKFPSPNFMLVRKSSAGSNGFYRLNKNTMKAGYQTLHDLFRPVE